MDRILTVRKYHGDYSISIPRKIGRILEEENVCNMICTLTENNELLFKGVKVN